MSKNGPQYTVFAVKSPIGSTYGMASIFVQHGDTRIALDGADGRSLRGLAKMLNQAADIADDCELTGEPSGTTDFAVSYVFEWGDQLRPWSLDADGSPDGINKMKIAGDPVGDKVDILGHKETCGTFGRTKVAGIDIVYSGQVDFEDWIPDISSMEKVVYALQATFEESDVPEFLVSPDGKTLNCELISLGGGNPPTFSCPLQHLADDAVFRHVDPWHEEDRVDALPFIAELRRLADFVENGIKEPSE
jgi:hypothetical protein